MAFLEGPEQPLAASAITIAELDVGVREGVERQRLEAFAVLPLDRQAALWPKPRHGPGRGLGPRPDAL